MKWIKQHTSFINEIKSNPTYQDKVKLSKKIIRNLLPTSVEVNNLIMEYFFTKEYNDFCGKYLIPIVIVNDYDNSFVKYENYAAYGSLDVTNERYEYNYARNVYGMMRFLSDINACNYGSFKSVEEDNLYSKNYIECNPLLYFKVYVSDNSCECELEYDVNYYGYEKIKINLIKNKVIKNMTEEDVNEVMIQCLKEGYNRLLSSIENFETLYKSVKETTISYLKKEINDNNNYKLNSIIKHYPNILKDIDLDADSVNTASEMDDMGF